MELVGYLLRGYTYDEIGALQKVSSRSVQHNAIRIRHKLGVKTHSEMMEVLRSSVRQVGPWSVIRACLEASEHPATLEAFLSRHSPDDGTLRDVRLYQLGLKFEQELQALEEVLRRRFDVAEIHLNSNTAVYEIEDAISAQHRFQ